MIENNRSNTTKLVSQFLEFKYIFYEFYKFVLCCCELTERSVGAADSPPGKNMCAGVFCWDEHWHRRTVRENDGQFGKMTNNTGAKTLEMISGASGLQIKCGLFLWLSSDVRKLFQVLDVSCMVCEELVLIHGGNPPLGPWSSWEAC